MAKLENVLHTSDNTWIVYKTNYPMREEVNIGTKLIHHKDQQNILR